MCNAVRIAAVNTGPAEHPGAGARPDDGRAASVTGRGAGRQGVDR